MAAPYIVGQTLDDLMRSVLAEIESNGVWIKPSKGGCTELTGVLLEITNPRARLSRTEIKGTPFSCLGELCWYLARSNSPDFIEYYIRGYGKYADGDELFGAYGPRLFDWRGINQLDTVIDVLRRKPASRQAVIQLFDAADITQDHNDVPCTCTLQFMIRQDRLHMVTTMRSNDAFIGLPHDVFAFTMLQEIMARSLSVEVGGYKHAVGSLHLYDTSVNNAQLFLKEGWMPTETVMPPMPLGDPWPSINSLLEAESAIRRGSMVDPTELDDLDSYWGDLIRLLQVFRFSKNKDPGSILEIRGRMSSNVYHPFIDKRLSQLS